MQKAKANNLLCKTFSKYHQIIEIVMVNELKLFLTFINNTSIISNYLSLYYIQQSKQMVFFSLISGTRRKSTTPCHLITLFIAY